MELRNGLQATLDILTKKIDAQIGRSDVAGTRAAVDGHLQMDQCHDCMLERGGNSECEAAVTGNVDPWSHKCGMVSHARPQNAAHKDTVTKPPSSESHPMQLQV